MPSRTHRAAAGSLMALLVAAVSGCAPQQPPTPEQARDSVVDTVGGTRRLFADMDWTDVYGGIPTPGECIVGEQKGVDFSVTVYTPEADTDRTADAQKVAAYWQSLGISVRTVADPYPAVYGTGGPVKAIAFSSAPRYSIQAGGWCVPGNPYDFYDVTPSSSPPAP